MTFLFYWTGALIWSTLALLLVIVISFVLLQYTLSTLNVLAQLYWLKRSNQPRGKHTPWQIIVQDAHMMTPAGLVRDIIKYVRWGNRRYTYSKVTGYQRLDGSVVVTPE